MWGLIYVENMYVNFIAHYLKIINSSFWDPRFLIYFTFREAKQLEFVTVTQAIKLIVPILSAFFYINI